MPAMRFERVGITTERIRAELDRSPVTDAALLDLRHLDVVDAAQPSAWMEMPGRVTVVMHGQRPALERHRGGTMDDDRIGGVDFAFRHIVFDRCTNQAKEVLRMRAVGPL